MKILYGIQGTGNGHITRAIEILPYLQLYGEVDILISGYQSEIPLPFEVKYKMNGISFIFGKEGGVDFWRTYKKLNSIKFLKEVNQLKIKKYDLIISDFEPVTAWAAIKAKKSCVGLSNQIATLHPKAPKPKYNDIIGKLVLNNYAPTNYNYGFHFKSLDTNIFTPIIRQEVRSLDVSDEGYYTIYLPSYADEKIIKHLSKFKDIEWQVFSKHSNKKYKEKNISIRPIETDSFLKSISNCTGVICNAGFGVTSEALFLNKKLLVIPMKQQYEQHCNAAMLKSMGVPVIKKLNSDYIDDIKKFLKSDERVAVDYPDNAHFIIHQIVKNHGTLNAKITPPASLNYNLFQ